MYNMSFDCDYDVCDLCNPDCSYCRFFDACDLLYEGSYIGDSVWSYGSCCKHCKYFKSWDGGTFLYYKRIKIIDFRLASFDLLNFLNSFEYHRLHGLRWRLLTGPDHD